MRGLLLTLLLLLTLNARAFGAFASVATFCGTQDKVGANPWIFATSAQLNKDNLGIIVVATDNVTGTDGDNNEHTSVTDAAGNTWTQAKEFTNGQTGAATGATVSLWYSKASANLASGANVTVNFSASIVAKAVTCWQFTMNTAKIIAIDGSGTLANDGADAGPMTLSGLANIEHLFVRGGAVESSGTTYTASTNYTAMLDGASTTTSGGASASNMGARGEFRILTATSDSTDPVTSADDQASVMVALSETDPATGPPIGSLSLQNSGR